MYWYRLPDRSRQHHSVHYNDMYLLLVDGKSKTKMFRCNLYDSYTSSMLFSVVPVRIIFDDILLNFDPRPLEERLQGNCRSRQDLLGALLHPPDPLHHLPPGDDPGSNRGCAGGGGDGDGRVGDGRSERARLTKIGKNTTDTDNLSTLRKHLSISPSPLPARHRTSAGHGIRPSAHVRVGSLWCAR